MKKRSRTVRPKTARPARAASARPFRLDAEHTLAGAAELKARLAKVLASDKPVTLDISTVQRIDTASMQLLSAFVRHRQEHGRKVRWSASTPAFAQAARLLGLSDALALAGDAPLRRDASLSGNAPLSGDAPVAGNAPLSSNAPLSGDAPLAGNAALAGDAA